MLFGGGGGGGGLLLVLLFAAGDGGDANSIARYASAVGGRSGTKTAPRLWIRPVV